MHGHALFLSCVHTIVLCLQAAHVMGFCLYNNVGVAAQVCETAVQCNVACLLHFSACVCSLRGSSWECLVSSSSIGTCIMGTGRRTCSTMIPVCCTSPHIDSTAGGSTRAQAHHGRCEQLFVFPYLCSSGLVTGWSRAWFRLQYQHRVEQWRRGRCGLHCSLL